MINVSTQLVECTSQQCTASGEKTLQGQLQYAEKSISDKLIMIAVPHNPEETYWFQIKPFRRRSKIVRIAIGSRDLSDKIR